MVRLRLRRMGARKAPTYRVVAADSTSPRDGRFLEVLGHYNPRTEPATIVIDEEKALKWLRNGAQASETVEKLLRQAGIWEQFKPGDAPRTWAPKAEPKTEAKAEPKAEPKAEAPSAKAEEPAAEEAAADA